MMTFVKWTFTDTDGHYNENEAWIDWFDTAEEAKKFVKKKKKRNGGYFKLLKLEEGDYKEFLEMEKLKVRLEYLKNKF